MRSIALIFVLLNSVLFLNAQETDLEINYNKLEKLISFCDTTTEATEVLIYHKNKEIAFWRNGECHTYGMTTSSMVKSWTSLVVGILIDHKIIDGIDTPVSKYIPDWEAGSVNKITIKHLITMTAGMNRRSGSRGILVEKNMKEYLLNFEPDTLPDIRFGYSNESVQLLGMIIEEATGMEANAVFKKYLFEPLGMDSTNLVKDEAGNDIVFGGTKTTIRDASKVGKLMMQKGNFNGKQIVSKQWITASLRPGKHAPFYGYLWWLDNASKNPNYAATGDGGQLTIIYPELDLLFLRNQSCFPNGGHRMPWMGPYFLNLIADIVQKPLVEMIDNQPVIESNVSSIDIRDGKIYKEKY
ncbi:MAG: hypothetical protein C0595_10600 [Marinilabiliales bacterium]|nr:MAG: hypothetical protein C0595_10600 [Marinilabiliales bacterium]